MFTLQNIGEVSKKIIEVEIHTVYQLVYRLIELVLMLPVATVTVKRAFSVMNIIKTDLRNKMGNDFLTDCLVCYNEKNVFRSIDNKDIIQHFLVDWLYTVYLQKRFHDPNITYL